MTDDAPEAPEITDEQAEAILADAAHEDDDSQSDDDEQSDTKSLQAELDRWKTHARKQETRAKQNADAAKRLQQIEDEKKTNEQRLSEQLQNLQSELDGYKTREIAQKAAADAGLPGNMAKFITAADPDDAAAQAKELAKHVKAAQPAANLRQGARAEQPKRPSVDEWIRQQAGRA